MISASLDQELSPFRAPSCETAMPTSSHCDSGRRPTPAVSQGMSFIVTLAKWRAAALKTRGPVNIVCLSGQLWITQLGNPGDTVLQAGQRHVFAQATRDIVLSTAGSPYPATFEIVARFRPCRNLWSMLQRSRPYFELTMPRASRRRSMQNRTTRTRYQVWSGARTFAGISS